MPSIEKISKEAKSWMIRVTQYHLKDLKKIITTLSKKEKNKEIIQKANATIERIDSLLN